MQQATSKLIRAAMEDLDVEPKKKPARATAQKDTTKKAATDHAATAKNNAKATAKHGKSGFKNQREDSEEQLPGQPPVNEGLIMLREHPGDLPLGDPHVHRVTIPIPERESQTLPS